MRRLASALVVLALVPLWGASSAPPDAAAAAACPDGAVAIRPGQSIQTAIDRAPPGASFCLKAGTHRLQSAVPRSGQSFYGEPGSVLSGARLLTGFRRAGRFWVAPEQNQKAIERGACLPADRPCRQPAGFFIDGVRLRQVNARDEVGPDSFLFDRAAREIWFAADPTGRQVEASFARYAFHGVAPRVLFRGLTVEKYNNPAQEGAIHGKAAAGWRIERSVFRLNDGAGAAIGPDGAVVDCDVVENGQLGIAASGRNLTISGNRISGNNTLGFDPGWDAGGVKVTFGEGVVLRGNQVDRNNGPGLWCDIDCRDVVIEGNRVERNLDSGIFFEISERARIAGNVVRLNGLRGNAWVWGAQIQIAASEETEVTGNDVTVPAFGHAIMLIDQGRAREAGGLYKTRRNAVHDNVVRFEGPGRAGGTSDRPPGTENAGIIETGGNSFDRNTYLAAPGGPEPRFLWGYDEMPFRAFQDRGQERNGSLRSR